MSEKLRELQIEIEQEIIDNYEMGGISENGFESLMNANNRFDEYIDQLECDSINTPKHETVEQWEARTGETYPDDAPVWFLRTVGSATNEDGWHRFYELGEWVFARGLEIVYVANHHGKPEIEELENGK